MIITPRDPSNKCTTLLPHLHSINFRICLTDRILLSAYLTALLHVRFDRLAMQS
jgi:hypothetical protein